MKVKSVAVIGECMVELQKAGEGYKQSFGGDTLNTALYLARQTKDLNVNINYLTGMGKDPFSRSMIDSWKKEGITTSSIYISDTKLPGMYAIETSPDGERSFYYWRNDAAARFWIREYTPEKLASLLSQSDFLYLSGISLAILPEDCLDILFEALTIYKKGNGKIAFDNNYRPTLWGSKLQTQEVYKRILSLTDIAFLTYDDEELLYGDTSEPQSIERTQKLGVGEIVVKRGAEACFVITQDEGFIEVPANQVLSVVDTTAAGDSFSAGYLAKRLTGGTTQESALAGHLLAGTVIQYPGAIIPTHAMPLL